MTTTDRISGLVSSVAIKAPCRLATTANITLNGLQSIDGVTTVSGDRVLVKSQTDATTNGIYVADTGDWVRPPDFDGTGDCVQGTLVMVVSGTINGSTVFQLTTASPVIGTSALAFTVAGAAALALASLYMRTSFLPLTSASAAALALGNAPNVVRDFGADPTGLTDSSGAFLAAETAYPGSVIEVPEGTYLWTTARTLLGTAIFEGVGWNERNQTPSIARAGTWILFTNPAINPITFSGASAAGLGGFRRIAFEQTHALPSATSSTTASISGTTLTWGGSLTGSVVVGMGIGGPFGAAGANLTPGTVITAGSGPTYTVNISQTVSSQAMNAWAPTVYGPVITVSSVGGTLEFDDLYFYNIYAGINVPGNHGTNGRLRLGKITGQVFSYLLNASCILDQSYADDIHVWNVWSADTSVLNWQIANGIPVQLARTDGFSMKSLFGINYKALLKLTYDNVNSPNGPTTNLHIDKFYADGCQWGWWVTGDGTTLSINDHISGGTAWLLIPDSYGGQDDSSGSFISIGTARVQSCAKNCFNQTSTSGASTIQIGRAFLSQWNLANDSSPAFNQFGTSGGVHTLMLGAPPVLGTQTHVSALQNSSVNLLYVAGILLTKNLTVAALPDPAVAGGGARSYVIDATSNTFGADPAGGGSDLVPVFSTGAVWKIG